MNSIMKIVSAGNELYFPYDVRHIREVNGVYVVLLIIPHSENFVNNVYGVNSGLQVIWQIQDPREKYEIENHLPYEHVSVDHNTVTVSNFYGLSYKINPQTGEILEKKLSK